MKAKVIKTGEIVDVRLDQTNGHPCGEYIEINGTRGFSLNALSFIDNNSIDCEQRRFELVKEVICSLLSNPNLILNDDTLTGSINLGVKIADEVIAKLKEE